MFNNRLGCFGLLKYGAFFSLLTLSLGGSCRAQVADAAMSIQVELTDVDAPATLAALGRWMGIPVVVGPSAKQRISLSGTYHSKEQVIAKMAEQAGAVVLQHGGIRVIRATCLPGTIFPVNPPKDEARLSLYFQDVDLATFASLLDARVSGTVQAVEKLKRQSIAMSMRDVPRREAMEAVALAVGMHLRYGPGEDPVWRPLPVSDACEAARRSGSLATQKWPSPLMPRNNHCPYRVQNEEDDDAHPARKCGPLEFFPLHTLYVGGYVRANDRVFALIESPDGVMTLARVGDYMGQDFGRINEINHAGVTVREFISDVHNEYHDVSNLLNFGARPPATASSRAEHAEVGSPLREYSTSLGFLFSDIRFPAELAVVCMRRFPASESVIKTALSRWRSQNGRVLKEIDRHVFAYMERHSQRTGESAALVEKKYQDEVSRLTENLFRQWDEDSEEYLRDRCQDYGSGLSGLENDLETRYKVKLGVLRKCAAAATCPNLRER